jgi:hypothetical protein
MTTQHKHAEAIKAWADGAQIEVRYLGSLFSADRTWRDAGRIPLWGSDAAEFRVKPTHDEQTDDCTGICEVSE